MIAAYEAALPPGGWPNWVLGNHDRPRIAERVGEAQARVAAMLLLTLRGTPTIYYGDDLGLHDTPIPPDKVQDPRELREPGLGLGRDPVRTPMPWDGRANAGFTTGEPWLPLNADWPTRNVEAQTAKAGSMLDLHRRLLALRREYPALSLGDITLLPVIGDVLVYERRLNEDRLHVALNLGGAPVEVEVANGAEPLLSTLDEPPPIQDCRMTLRANEGVVLTVRP
jgi:alpha-glucosidase